MCMCHVFMQCMIGMSFTGEFMLSFTVTTTAEVYARYKVPLGNSLQITYSVSRDFLCFALENALGSIFFFPQTITSVRSMALYLLPTPYMFTLNHVLIVRIYLLPIVPLPCFCPAAS